MSKITVHICTRERYMELYTLLESLRVQSFKEWDLIIVDESSQPVFNIECLNKVITQLRLEGHKVIVSRSESPGVVNNRNQCFKIQEKEFPDVEWSCRIDDDSVLDKDYLENLMSVVFYMDKKDRRVGAVGGIVPLYGVPTIKRSIDKVKNDVFNYSEFDSNGEIIVLGDDGGFNYLGSPKILESHHLRSSFLINNKAAKEVGYYDTVFQGSAFREETDFCFKLLEKGYKLFTDTGAVCWHLRSSGGGLRLPNYAESVQSCEHYFRTKWKRKYELGFRL